MLIAACFFVYMSSICIKLVYSSEIVEIIDKFQESKARVGLGLTAYYLTYAATQLILAPFVKKINMGKLMVWTLTLSAILYGIIPFTTALYQLWIILALNGVLQSSVWGGCMYFFGKFLPAQMNGPACSIMSIGYIGGTVVSYVIAPIFIANGIWQYAFLLFAALMFVAVVVFIFVERKVENVLGKPQTTESNVQNAVSGANEQQGSKHLVFTIVTLLSVAALVVYGVYFVISSWFPVYLNNVFSVSATSATLVTVILYVASFICDNLGIILCNQWRIRFSNISRVFITTAVTMSLVQFFMYKSYLWLAVVIMTLTIAFVRATGTLITTYLPLRIKDSMNPATTAMVFNAAASLGAAIGPVSAGSVVDSYGWGVYFAFLLAVCLLAFLLVAIATHFSKRMNI